MSRSKTARGTVWEAQDNAVNSLVLGSFLEGMEASADIPQHPLELGNGHLLKVFSVSWLTVVHDERFGSI